MKNNFAFNNKNELVNINNVDKKQKENYFCINCGDEMIARKGKIKAHHFSHKIKACSYESYLHKLAKLKFYLSYSKCLVNNDSFHLEYFIDQKCTSCLDNFNINCDFKNTSRLFDLTKTFNQIDIEKGVNGFIADILLSSTKTNEKILVEFAVKHFCSAEKKMSGLRIIEIPIENENNLDFLKYKSLTQQNVNFQLINFKNKSITKNIFKPHECKNHHFLFRIDENGKAYSYSAQMRVILSDLYSHKYSYFEIIKDVDSYDEPEYFIDLVKKASHKGIKVMNCHACKFLKPNRSRLVDSAWFCTKHKAGILNSNYACEKLWRIDKPVANNGYK